ncbi:MAG: hypothetical protein ABI380_07625 [Edaphobacter sp.]
MQTWLFAANMLVLAVLACIAYRMILAARRRAGEVHSAVLDRQSAVDRDTDPETDSETTNKESSSTFADQCEESLLETMVAPSVPASTVPDSVQPTIAEDLPYADPVDGMPFESGEPVVACICGLAYREDSVQWLWDYHAGCCIHCGAIVALPKQSS